MREHMSEFFDEHHIDAAAVALFVMQQQFGGSFGTVCLLYTSDAADE